MKKLVLIFACSIGVQFVMAQQRAVLDQGDKTVCISINPVFSYIGNIFTNQAYNTLDISSASLQYRKVTKPNRAVRLSFSLNISQNQTYINYNFDPYSRVQNQAFFRFIVEKEYFKAFGESKNWRIFAGWGLGPSFRSYKVQNNYENEVPVSGGVVYSPYIRDVSYQGDMYFGVAGRLFLGVEYFISQNLFVGLDLALMADIQYVLNSQSTIEYYNYNSSEGKYELDKVSEEKRGSGIVYNIDNYSPVLFRIGVKFCPILNTRYRFLDKINIVIKPC